ncbi:PAS domain-containing protein [Streptomyces olivaceoviridis]|uniref:PAS domain-containing protein n=1 Tax=Streptomyces olivaceoviridis TaxID=1921 RepID=UPI0036A7481E
MTSIADELGSVFDVIRQPVWAVDADHSVRYANPAAAEVLGHGRPSDLLGMDGCPAEVPGIDRGPADLPGTDGRPSTLLGTDGRPAEVPGTDGRPSDLLSFDGRPSDLLGMDGCPADVPGTDRRPSGPPGTDGGPATASGQPETAGRTGPASGRGTLTRVDGSLLPVEWTRVPLSRPGGDAVLYAFVPLAGPARAGRGMPDDGPFPLLAHRQVERQHRYARTLQHTVQERLVRALLGLGLARQELGPAPARVIDLLHDVVRDTEAALAGVREVTDALSPGALRAGGLPAALAALAGRCPVPMTVSGSLSGRLPRLVESHLYLLVAEAVERAVENGGADRVRVTADLGASLVVTVVDDGAPPAGAADLAALAALTERAASLDGTLRVRHTPGAGTTVTAVVPL